MAMEPIKVVIRYADGKVAKGYTHDFFPNKTKFHLNIVESPQGEGKEIQLSDLKAVFFVRDFGGDPLYDEEKLFKQGQPISGRKVEVTFSDGEVLVGTTMGYDPNRPGFFLFPADSKSNNLRVFVVSAAVIKVRQL